MTAVLKSIAGFLLGRYTIFKIYMIDGPSGPQPPKLNVTFATLDDVDELARSHRPELRALVGFFGYGAHAFGAWVDGRLVAASFYWAGNRYKDHELWPLSEREAKLVRIATSLEFRGRGIAAGLICFSTARMYELGYGRLYAKIWHSNKASIATFSKAGWRHVATVVHVFPFGKRLRWCFRHAADRRQTAQASDHSSVQNAHALR